MDDPEIYRQVDPMDAGQLAAFFTEMTRLVTEAQSRAKTGEVLQALSSLAALPRVHRMVVDHCEVLLVEPTGQAVEDPEEVSYGLYL